MLIPPFWTEGFLQPVRHEQEGKQRQRKDSRRKIQQPREAENIIARLGNHVPEGRSRGLKPHAEDA
ncbi:hypothetical protein D3C80_2106960 [compost metagenome]